MKSRSSQAGTGTTGCFLFILLSVVLVFVGFRVGPDYYAYKSLETDTEREIARAGSQFLDDGAVLHSILMLGKRNNVRLTEESVKIERFAGQIHVTVRYMVPFDLLVYQTEHEFVIKSSSFVGRL